MFSSFFLHPTIFCKKSKRDDNGEIRDATAHDYDVEVSDCGGGGDRRRR